MTRVLLVDHEDSFTRNVAAWLGWAGGSVRIRRSPTPDDLGRAQAVVLGPGPGPPGGRPGARSILDSWPSDRPLLGICLGCQALAAWGGMEVGPGDARHGETVPCHHEGKGLFAGLPSPFAAPRYNSLAISGSGRRLSLTGWDGEGSPLALAVADRPWHGLMFHPDSHLFEEGPALARSFLEERSTARGTG